MRKGVTRDDVHQWQATIQLDDFPPIDPQSEAGQEQLFSFCAGLHWRDRTLTHFLVKRGEEEICELFFAPPQEKRH